MSQQHHTIRTLPPGQTLRLRRWMLACCLLLGLAAQALHIKGGWIYYSYLGPGSNNELRYKVVVKVYRDCAPPNPGQNDPQINISVYTGNGVFYRDFQAQQVSSYRLAKTSYSECVNPKPEVCYVILEYQTEISLPASPQGYTLSFQRCCRINGIVNVLQPSNSIGNTYTVTIPGTAVNTAFAQNSSPVFNMKDTVLVCYNSNFTLDYGATDDDGDSLHFYFTDALMGADQGNPNPTRATPPPYGSIPYSAGFSATNPFGTNVQINSRTGLITGRSPSATGEYVLAVGVDEYRNGTKIASTRKELHVNVAGCTIAAAQLPPTIQNCDSFTVRFENQSHSPAILSYYWDFGVPNRSDDISTMPAPVFTYPDTGVYRAKLVINRETGCSDSAFTDVRIYPGFFPGFTVSGSCFASDFVFTDTSRVRYGRISSWRWDFGNTAATNDTSRLQQARYRYPGIGSYSATFQVASDKGCSKQFSFPVQVTDKPALSLAFRDTLICSIDTLMLRAGGTGTFQWAPSPTLINGNTATPLVFPKTTSRYVVTLTENSCVATDSVQVRVIDQVSLDAGPDTTLCLTDGAAMRPVSNGLSFRWQPAAIFDDANRRNAVATPNQPTTRVYVTAAVGKCSSTDSLTIRTVPYPTVNAGNDTIICYADTVFLRGSTNATQYAWSPAAPVFAPRQLVTAASINQTTTFRLTVTDNKGCPKPVTDEVLVTVRPRITVNAGNDTTAVLGQRLQLLALTNAPDIRWTPATGLSNPLVVNPVALYQTGTVAEGTNFIRYTITGTTPEGCEGSDELIVRLFNTGPDIFVPSAFTPNNDGLNDVIRPTLAGVQSLEYFRVYNRYGQLLFETRQPGKGWDGRFNGTLQPSNAFVYQCQAIDFEGKPLYKKGTFVLIR